METKYRLKEQARPFVSERLWNKSLTKEQWNGFNISENALEEVPTVNAQVGFAADYPLNNRGVHVIQSIQKSNWSVDFGGKLFFTVNVLKASFGVFQKFENEQNRKKLCEALEQKAQEIVAEIVNDKNQPNEQ